MPRGVYPRLSLEELFWSHVDRREPDECWPWTGTRQEPSGHGRTKYHGKQYVASRLSWEIHHGCDPGAGFVCHTCDNGWCVNPAHLYLGDAVTNARDRSERGRSRNSRVTECPRGHPYDEANTSVRKNGSRACRACARMWTAQRKAAARG